MLIPEVTSNCCILQQLLLYFINHKEAINSNTILGGILQMFSYAHIIDAARKRGVSIWYV